MPLCLEVVRLLNAIQYCISRIVNSGLSRIAFGIFLPAAA
jgi:uncharacterized membrane protein YjjP (DUF1212 family)